MRGAIVFGRNPATGAEPAAAGDDLAADDDGDARSAWYRRVVKACQLETDLDALPGGDAAEVRRGVGRGGGVQPSS